MPYDTLIIIELFSRIVLLEGGTIVTEQLPEKNISAKMKPSFQPDIPLLIEGIPYPTMILDTEFRITTMNRLLEAM
ncbi:MAG: hypothetical protein V2I35_02440, partial [Desulfocapsaceae bacterium]|nr:hypothetical protein [Desulfocapsaceae bacterium]